MIDYKKYAQLFRLLCENFNGDKLGKKVTQKIFYFFEREGISLNLRYGIHFYGPYSSKLDNIMHMLENEEYIFIDTTGTTHVISQGSKTDSINTLTENEEQIAKKVINNLSKKTPLELEALATMDYIANTLLPDFSSEQDIISKFKEIKGNKFTDTYIEKTFSELTDTGLISANLD